MSHLGHLSRTIAAPAALVLLASSGTALAAPRSTAASPPKTTPKTIVVQNTRPAYKVTATIPQLVWNGHTTIATNVNAQILDWAHQQIALFANSVTLDLSQMKKLPKSLPASTLTITYHPDLLSAQVASFQFIGDSYMTGQADITQIPFSLVFNLSTGHPVALQDLFKPHASYLPLLSQLSTTKLQQWHPAGARCYVGGKPPATLAAFRAWSLAPGGLALSFPAGIYTAAYCGVPTITVPASALHAVLASGGLLAEAAPAKK